MNIKCIFGHDWSLVAINSDAVWRQGGHVHLSFYECKRCAKRKATGNGPLKHKYAAALCDRWVKAGALPEGSRPHKAELRVVK